MAQFNGTQTSINIPQPDVNAWFNFLTKYLDSSYSGAVGVAGELSTPTMYWYLPNIDYEKVNTNIGLGDASKPRTPTINTGSYNAPASPYIAVPSILSIGTPPALTAASPDLNLPAVPSPLEISAPVVNFTVDTSIDMPVTPDFVLPTVPTLAELNIPSPAVLDIPLFDMVMPTSNSIVVPGITFDFNEDMYSDELLRKVTEELLIRLDGGTGLSPKVEEALWNRERDREQRASLQAERSLLSDGAATGLTRPAGSIRSALDNIIQETQSKIIDLSREIAIKQADLEQKNIENTIQQSIALEDILIREYGNIAQRRFEAAKYIQDLAVEIFKVEVMRFNSQLEAYKAFASAYTARVQGELAKVEVYKAEIDAQKLIGDINEQNIRIYVASLEGIKANVEIYRALISAVEEKLNAEKLKVEIYKTEIEIYTEQVKAKALEFTMYSDQIKGEMSKVDVFDSQVKAYASQIQAYASMNEVAIKKAGVEVDIEGLKVKAYEASLDGYIKRVQADQMTYAAAIDLYKGETEMYMADVGYNTKAAELALKVADNTIQQNKFASDLAIQNAQISLKSLEGSVQNYTASKTAAGQIYQGLASTAMSAIHVGSTVDQQVQVQGSESHSG